MGNLECKPRIRLGLRPLRPCALAATNGHFALRICAIDPKNAPMAAEALDKIKQCLTAAQISVEVENIKVKPLRAGSKLTLQDIFVVATLLSNAYKMLRLVCNDRGQPAKAQTGCGSLFSLIKRKPPKWRGLIHIRKAKGHIRVYFIV